VITTTGGMGSSNFSLPPGTYMITETVPAGWDLKSLEITQEDGGLKNSTKAGAKATLVVEPGETIVVTYVDTKRAAVRVDKKTEGGNGTFTFTTTGNNGLPASFVVTTTGGMGSSNFSLPPGTYMITETVPAGWDLKSLEITQEDGGLKNSTKADAKATLVVEPGETIVVTYTNALLVELQTVQFITPMSVYRPEGPLAASPPPQGNVTISGLKWQDINQNGLLDNGEQARRGWRVFADVSSNGVFDGLFDPQTERSAVTGQNGTYTLDLTGLADGTYAILEDRGVLSEGTIRVQTVPSEIVALGGQHGYTVEIQNGQVVGSTTSFNFGDFEYSPFVRPADDERDQYRIRLAGDPGQLELLTALTGTSDRPWQSFHVTNHTGASFEITSIEKNASGFSDANAQEFVRVYLIENEHLVPVDPLDAMETDYRDLNSQPIVVGHNQSVRLFVFYDPAIRSSDRAAVEKQYPDWYDDPDTPANESNRAPHTFGREDHLNVVTRFVQTSQSGPTFRVNLVGGSTFDSDIFYDGLVARGDLNFLNDVLVKQWPTKDVAGSTFDPLSDINARFPDGAEKSVATKWPITPINGSPAREIGLGDFGPLNVEWAVRPGSGEIREPGRGRAPFIDHDADKS
jgi:hypothetical protein